ncbi:DUF4097 family beta strand repeat-containing protein [Plantactinospora soyae]|uniref:DUF4097 domain-containing protein n=1 Tax=Plantactinospora soyae TaxID=1544732 RepID=A0A927MDQ2_9ACTN|nr:DUF4097 family beta strand repeat-containing protein [Plantactinospora soyae]MBE1492843.1 hypothetical protein [Plantactinospora soyae]
MLLSRTVTHSAMAGAAALIALISLSACNGLAEQRLTFDRTEDVKVTEIEIAPGSGDVEVRTGAVTNVRIKRVVQYRGDEPTGATYRIDGTKLHLDTDCGRNCGVSYEVLAPEGVAVRGTHGSGDVSLTAVSEVDLEVGSGEINVTDASGKVRAQTGSGDISLSRVRGEVSARADSGSIEGRDLGPAKVQAETGSGNITLSLTAVASIQAHASSGSVELIVPTGDYQVRATAESGSTNLAVPNVATATATLDARTGSGDISIQRS